MHKELNSAVLLVGEALVDEFHERQIAGGAPFNVARSLGALLANEGGGSAPVCLVSRIGHDDVGGALIRASLQRFERQFPRTPLPAEITAFRDNP